MECKQGNLRAMKVVFALALILLLLVIGLPFAMSPMGHMGDCPACTLSKAPYGIGLCAGILSFMALIVLMAGDRFRIRARASRRFLLTSSIFKPPRPV